MDTKFPRVMICSLGTIALKLTCSITTALFLYLGLTGKSFGMVSPDEAFGLTGLRAGMSVAELTATLQNLNVPVFEHSPGNLYISFLNDDKTKNQVEVHFAFENSKLVSVTFVINGEKAWMQAERWRAALRQNFGRPTQRIYGGEWTFCLSNNMYLWTTETGRYATKAYAGVSHNNDRGGLCKKSSLVDQEKASLYSVEASQSATFGFATPVDLKTGFERRDGIEPTVKSSDPVIAAQQFESEKRYDKAIALLQEAAAAGNASATNNLAKFYSDGTGVPQDKQKALELYKAAAKLGSRKSAYNVAYMYLHGGPGLPIDTTLGIQWMERAAAAHDPDAVDYLDKLESQKKSRYISENALEPAVENCLSVKGNGYSQSTTECVDYNSRGCVSVERKTTVASDRTSVTNICSRPVSFRLLCQSESAVTLRPGDSRDVPANCNFLRRK